MNDLVLFDVDGTVCDTCEVDDESFRATACAMLGIPYEMSAWEESPHVTDYA